MADDTTRREKGAEFGLISRSVGALSLTRSLGTGVKLGSMSLLEVEMQRCELYAQRSTLFQIFKSTFSLNGRISR
jgi:hypothetical protein